MAFIFGSVNEQIETYKALSAQIKEIEAQQAEIKNGFLALMEQEGVNKLVFEAGTVTLTKDSTLISYKAASLDALRASSDEFFRLLDPHRTETVKKGYLMVR